MHDTEERSDRWLMPPQDETPQPAVMDPVPALEERLERLAAPPLTQAPHPRVDLTYRGHATWVWLSTHGGAGATSLARSSTEGIDLHRQWPHPNLGWPMSVVLVARTNARGLDSAGRFLHEWVAGVVPDVNVLALVAMADAPGRTPRAIRSRLHELSGSVTVLQCPWVDEWRETPDVPAGDVRKIATTIAAMLNPKE